MARYFIALYALALFAAVASAVPLESDVDFDDLANNAEISFNSGRDNGPDAKKHKGIKATIKKFFTELKKYVKEEFIDRVHMSCVMKVPLKCGLNPFKEPQEYYKCASDYFKKNKERCIKPKQPKAEAIGSI